VTHSEIEISFLSGTKTFRRKKIIKVQHYTWLTCKSILKELGHWKETNQNNLLSHCTKKNLNKTCLKH